MSAQHTVLVLGSGAVGLMYGGRLLEAELCYASKLNVHFALRSDFNLCSRKGFQVWSDDGDIYFSANDLHGRIHDHNLINAGGDMSIGRIDLIICAFKSTVMADSDSRSEVKSLLSRIVTDSTKILVLMNGLLCEEHFVDWFGSAAVFGGMAFTCINRLRSESPDDALIVHHMAHGALQIGHCQDDPQQMAQILELWKDTKIAHKVTTTDSLLRSRWLKLCWNIPFNGLAVSLGGVSTDVIVTDPDLRILADEIMQDVISLANAHLLSSSTSDRKSSIAVAPIDMNETRRFCWHLADTIGAYKTSTVLDLVNGHAMELEYMFGRALDVAMELSSDVKGPLDGVIGELRWPKRSNWKSLERIVRSVFAIERIAKRKASHGMSWSPTLLT